MIFPRHRVFIESDSFFIHSPHGEGAAKLCFNSASFDRKNLAIPSPGERKSWRKSREMFCFFHYSPKEKAVGMTELMTRMSFSTNPPTVDRVSYMFNLSPFGPKSSGNTMNDKSFPWSQCSILVGFLKTALIWTSLSTSSSSFLFFIFFFGSPHFLEKPGHGAWACCN